MPFVMRYPYWFCVPYFIRTYTLCHRVVQLLQLPVLLFKTHSNKRSIFIILSLTMLHLDRFTSPQHKLATMMYH